MNCQEALDLLYEIIDKEASEIDTKRVEEHLEHCRDCFEKYRLEQSVQDLLNAKLTSVNNPGNAEKVDVLKFKILDQLDKIDCEPPSKEQTRFFNLTSKVLVAVASLVLLIGAGFLSAKFFRHNDTYVPLERAHWAISKDIDNFQDSDNTSQLISSIQQQYKYSLSNQVINYNLVGGHEEEIMGVDMEHFVYTNGNDQVSVFVVPADKFQLSNDLHENKKEMNNITFFDHNCRGCRLVFHRIGSVIIITASTNNEVDLLSFIPGVSVI